MNPERTRCLAALLVGLVAFVTPAPAQSPEANGHDGDRLRAIAAHLPAEPAGLGVPADDRAAWQGFAEKPPFRAVVAKAARLLDEPIPDLTGELYLDFSRTGNRDRWQKVASRRSDRLYHFALAECLEDKGRFVDAYEAGVRALCAEPTWVMPAHDRTLANFEGKTIGIDLRSSRIAHELATADYLLGDRLSPEIRRLTREQVERRVLAPYRRMVTGKQKPNFWVTGTNNWNAVCHAGVVGAALWYVKPRADRAFFVAAAAKNIEPFLQGFGADGYCSEGVGYWNYGYGHFLLLAEMVHQATDGRVDFFAKERARLAARYGATIEIIHGTYPSFADCSVNARPSPAMMWFVNRKFDLKSSRWEQTDVFVPHRGLAMAMMFLFPNSVSRISVSDVTDRELPPRTYFESSGIVLCRPGDREHCRLGVGLKGGHNGEHHNHNDVGSYVVVAGDRTLLVDPGAEVYTARTFSSRRYESDVLNSFGHPVPVVAGALQRTGPDARGEIVQTRFTDAADTVVIDLRSAYNAPELETLRRTFVYSREEGGSLTVTDEVGFKSAKSFGTALVTFSEFEQVTPGTLRIQDEDQAVRVEIEVTGSPFELDVETLEADLRTTRKATRLGIQLTRPVKQAKVTVTATPTDASSKDPGS